MEKLQKIAMNRLNGIVHVEKNNDAFTYTNGYRDIINEIEINDETKFGVASIGKVFVAVAILKLIEEEQLSFETTLHDVLGNVGELHGENTILQLLTHTSDVPDYFDEEIMEDYSELWEQIPNYSIRRNADILPLFVDKRSKNEKGFCYNNSGYILLAAIIEKITNMKFDDYLKRIIFDKIGMKSTRYYELDKLPANTANGYINDTTTNIYSIDAKGTGAGGAFTTVHDMSLFWSNLFAGIIIKKELVGLMLDEKFSGVSNYGLGVWLLPVTFEENEYRIPFLQGVDPGVTALSLYDYKRNFQLSIFSNKGDDIGMIRREMFEHMYK